MKKLGVLVIALTIIVVAATHFVFNYGLPQPWSLSAKRATHQLAIALDDYYERCHSLPLASAHAEDRIIFTTGESPQSFMMNLVGSNSAADQSAEHFSYFDFKLAKKNKTDGLHRTENTAELFDPWGSPYSVLLDYDRDGKLKDPQTGQIIEGQNALIWSPGPDKKSGTEDDICSWK